MSQIKLIVYFLDNSPPRQVKRPNLERNEGGVDNGSYDNDDSNFSALTVNGTTYERGCVSTPRILWTMRHMGKPTNITTQLPIKQDQLLATRQPLPQNLSEPQPTDAYTIS